MIKRVFIGLIALLLAAGSVHACKWHGNDAIRTAHYRPHPAVVQLYPAADAVRLSKAGSFQPTKLLRDRLSNLQGESVRLELLHDILSPVGRHFSYEQYFFEFPVFDSQVKANFDLHEQLRSTIDNSYDTRNWDIDQLRSQDFDPEAHADYLAVQRAHYLRIEPDELLRRKVIAFDFEKNEAYLAYQIRFSSPQGGPFLEVLLSKEGIRFAKDLLNYAAPDTSGKAWIYNPDPITSAEVEYGDPYFDNNDQNNSELEKQRQLLDVEIFTTGNGLYYPANQFMRIDDGLSPPFLPPYEFSASLMDFKRDEDAFEALMCLYHITEYKRYIDALIDTNLVIIDNTRNPPVSKSVDPLVNWQIPVDPHGRNGADQSVFNFSAVPPQLEFGEGGIDDAEDADVIIHEFGHAIAYSAAPNSNVGDERQALDEGFCDYLAASYSRKISDFNWQKVFNWDGNDSWPGRPIQTAKKYPDDVVTNSIHSTGQIWSSMLMDLGGKIGLDETDELAIMTMYCMAPNINLPDATRILFQMDSMLNGASNTCFLHALAFYRGLVTDSLPSECDLFDPSIVVDAGLDTTICQGFNLQLGGDPSHVHDNDQVLWLPTSLVNEEEDNPVWFVTSSQVFTLQITDSLGFYNYDQVFVAAEACVPNFLDFQFINTYGFSTGESAMQVYIPGNFRSVRIRLYDLAGKRVRAWNNPVEPFLTIHPDDLVDGVYVLMAEERFVRRTIKLVKASGN